MLHTRRPDLHGRTPRQREYLRNIVEHDITFAVGPAGTGKTYLAVACAVDALEREAVKRIVLVRPAVEAGERLGFLPGDLVAKVDPYLRPLYDALYDLAGFERVQRALERSTIEIAPLAFMRGRTLNQSFIILDEAQNTTPEQMKMFLTRIGFGTKAVVTGDVTQIDLARGQKSGLVEAQGILTACAASRSPGSAPRTSCAIRWWRVSSMRTKRTKRARRPRAPTGVADDARGGACATLAVQYAAPRAGLPARASVATWLAQALPGRRTRITVRFVGGAEARRLNRDYRGRDYATNV